MFKNESLVLDYIPDENLVRIMEKETHCALIGLDNFLQLIKWKGVANDKTNDFKFN
jgi:hypothetical protein